MIISRLFIIGFLLSASEVSTHFAPNWSLEATTTLVLLFPPANLLAPVRNLDKCKTLRYARRLYSGKPILVKCIFSFGEHKCKNSQLSQIVKSFIIVYQIKKGSEMTEHEFYAQIQEDYYTEFAGAELSESFVDTNTHPEFFEFDDIPF